MTTASAETGIYWGSKGEYGPFREQENGEWAGWPDFGQVLRHFREKAEMSVNEFSTVYGKKFNKNGRPLTRMQVYRMEAQNQVPEDRSKRKFLAELLGIPPLLLGIPTLEIVTLIPHPKITGTVTKSAHTTLPKIAVDITKYQTTIRTRSALHYTGQIQKDFCQINIEIQELESLELQARGDLQYYIQETLFRYHLLAEKATRDQQQHKLAHYHANQAVRVAIATKDTDLIAAARYTRGRVYLQWGNAGTLVQGIFQIDIQKINKAIRDFKDARKAANNTEKSLHPQVVGLIDMYLSRAYALRSQVTGEDVTETVLTLLDHAAENVDLQKIHDPYERELITGTDQMGLIPETFHTWRANILTILGRSGTALEAIEHRNKLKEGITPKHFTRNQVGLNIVEADVYMGLGQFSKATQQVKTVIMDAQSINSMFSLDWITDIHGRLLKSPYKDHPNVKELGDMIHEITPQPDPDEEQVIEEEDY